MPVDPELIGELSVIIRRMEHALAHQHLIGINRKALQGAIGCVSHIQTRLIADEDDTDRPPPFGIERSLPEGDRG